MPVREHVARDRARDMPGSDEPDTHIIISQLFGMSALDLATPPLRVAEMAAGKASAFRLSKVG